MVFNRALLGAGILSALALAASPVQAQEDTFEWNGTMSSGQTLEVKGIVGSIRAVLASGNRAEVVARKRGDREDFQQVAVEVAEAGDVIVICAVYGSWNHGQNRCDPDDRGPRANNENRNRNVDMDVEVDYEVRVPAGVDFQGTLVSGEIDAQGLESDVTVTTVEGKISVVTSGHAWANSVSGDIEIQMGDLGGGDLDFHTVSGDIRLWLPSDFSADVDFSSLSGDFDSDFDLNVRTRRARQWVGSSIRGTIGDGGRELSINTISGDVELRRSRQ